MSLEATTWALKLPELDPASKLILVIIADASNVEREHACWLRHRTIAERTGVSRSTVQRKLGELEAAGLLKIEQRIRKSGGRSCNLYQLPMLQSDAGGPLHPDDAANASSGEAANASPGEAGLYEPELEPEEEPGASSSLMSTEERKRVAVRNVFDHWKTTYAPRAVFDRKRGSRINARLEERMHAGETLQDAEAALMLAITNAERDDWLAGRAERSSGYLTKLDTLLRDAAQVERLLEFSSPADEKDENYDEEAEHEAELRALRGEEPLVPDDDTPPPVAA